MTIKTQIIILTSTAVLAFASGRYSNTRPEVKTQTVIQADVKQNEDKKVNETVVETKKPDGTVTTVTKINENDATDTDETIHEQQSTEVKSTAGKWTISGLASANVVHPQTGLTYGLGVTRQLIGPVSVGAFGFTNGVVGVSLGVTF